MCVSTRFLSFICSINACVLRGGGGRERHIERLMCTERGRGERETYREAHVY